MKRYRSLAALVAGLVLIAAPLAGAARAADYDLGLGAYASGDYATALAEWRPLAEQGNADAQYGMAEMYDLGRGVAANAETAAQWYQRAAEAGSARAQAKLGTMFATGHGVPVDPSTAVVWWRKAAEQGSPAAQMHLAEAYHKGEGVERDLAQAEAWYGRAAQAGIGEARVGLFEVGKEREREARAAADTGMVEGQAPGGTQAAGQLAEGEQPAAVVPDDDATEPHGVATAEPEPPADTVTVAEETGPDHDAEEPVAGADVVQHGDDVGAPVEVAHAEGATATVEAAHADEEPVSEDTAPADDRDAEEKAAGADVAQHGDDAGTGAPLEDGRAGDDTATPEAETADGLDPAVEQGTAVVFVLADITITDGDAADVDGAHDTGAEGAAESGEGTGTDGGETPAMDTPGETGARAEPVDAMEPSDAAMVPAEPHARGDTAPAPSGAVDAMGHAEADTTAGAEHAEPATADVRADAPTGPGAVIEPEHTTGEIDGEAPVTPASEEPGAVAVAAASSAEPAPSMGAMPAEAIDPNGFRVWLASFHDEAAAKEAWIALSRRHNDVLGALHPFIVRVDGADGATLYRVQAGPFTSAVDAQAACAALGARSTYCVAIAP